MAAAETPIPRSTKLALVAMSLGVFVVANDFTALSVAIPEIEQSFDTSLSRAQWVINGYALVFGVLIVTGGRLADLYGRKKLFMVGATIFMVFSLACGLMPNVYGLIVSRGLMGVGGAIMWPAVLGMIYAMLPDDRAGLAGGLLMGVAGIGNAFGPLLGGVLTDALSWRWVFFVNLPVAGLAMLVTAKTVTESTGEIAERRMDHLGVGILSVGIVAILVALDQAPDDGFGSLVVLAPLVAGVLMLVAFVLAERRIGDRALVPSSVLRNRVFLWSCVTVLMVSAVFFSALLYLPQFLQKVLDFSPLESGAALLPLMAMFAVTSFVAGNLYDRLGSRVVVGCGCGALALGILLLSRLDDDWSYLSLVPGMVVLGIGVGLFYSSITTVAVTALDASQSSLAGGIVYMCQVAGGAVGLGVNTAIVASADSLTAGISRAFVVDGVLALVGLAIALRTASAHEPTHARHRMRGHHRALA